MFITMMMLLHRYKRIFIKTTNIATSFSLSQVFNLWLIMARHLYKNPNTTTKLSKPKNEYKIITQLTKTVEKQNIADINSVTIKHPKTATKFSKLIKQPEVITQQPQTL